MCSCFTFIKNDYNSVNHMINFVVNIIDSIEGRLKAQLVSGIEKYVQPQDICNYMKFHDRSYSNLNMHLNPFAIPSVN